MATVDVQYSPSTGRYRVIREDGSFMELPKPPEGTDPESYKAMVKDQILGLTKPVASKQLQETAKMYDPRRSELDKRTQERRAKGSPLRTDITQPALEESVDRAKQLGAEQAAAGGVQKYIPAAARGMSKFLQGYTEPLKLIPWLDWDKKMAAMQEATGAQYEGAYGEKPSALLDIPANLGGFVTGLPGKAMAALPAAVGRGLGIASTQAPRLAKYLQYATEYPKTIGLPLTAGVPAVANVIGMGSPRAAALPYDLYKSGEEAGMPLPVNVGLGTLGAVGMLGQGKQVREAAQKAMEAPWTSLFREPTGLEGRLDAVKEIFGGAPRRAEVYTGSGKGWLSTHPLPIEEAPAAAPSVMGRVLDRSPVRYAPGMGEVFSGEVHHWPWLRPHGTRDPKTGRMRPNLEASGEISENVAKMAEQRLRMQQLQKMFGEKSRQEYLDKYTQQYGPEATAYLLRMLGE